MHRKNLKLLKYWPVFFLQCACLHALSQSADADTLARRFNQYAGKAVQEKLFLHTDKEFYVAGEIAWFRIFYVDGSTHKPFYLSKLAYVEILNDKNEPVQQAKISLANDESRGSFYLPVSLSTGYYTIRAYTNWMKNFDQDYFFEKKIAIVNTLRAPKPGTVIKDPNDASAQFFPEGGNLVNGIRSRIGFIIKNKNGGVDHVQGFVVDKNNDTITSFSPLKFGIGSFYFTPQTGNTYKSVIVLPGGLSFSQPLPVAFDDGYAMKLEENSGQLMMKIWKKNANGQNRPEQMIVAAHTRQVLKIASAVFLNNNDSTSFAIDKKRLGEGISHITLFNANGKPVCERLFFSKPEKKISLTVKSDRQVYEKRQLINLSIGGAVPVNPRFTLSAAVFGSDTLQALNGPDIFDYMWLVSDLPGDIESPGYYFSNDPGAGLATDNLMLTYGWRRFKWDDIWKGGETFIKYQPEINGHLVTGILKDTRNGRPVPGENAYLSISGQPYGFYTATSDKNGMLTFEIRRYYGNSQVIAQPGIDVDTFYKVDILKPFAGSPAGENRYLPYPLSETVKDQLLKKSIGMQVQNIYMGDSLKTFYDPPIRDTLPFFGKPEKSYWLDDYKRFTTMEEVLREYVREIGVGVRHEKLVFKIFNPSSHDFYEGNELVLLDGVALTNTSRIFAYDPLKIKKIDVIRDRYVLGHATFNGVASFTTYDAMFDGFDLDPRLVAVDYSGLQLQREFYSPSYDTKEQLEKRLPDFRNTLFWDGNVQTNNDGSGSIRFYSSDLAGKYRVIVQGMDDDGNFVTATTEFEVK